MNYESFLQIALVKGIGDASIKKIINFIHENDGFSWDDLCCNKNFLSSILPSKENINQEILFQREKAKKLAKTLYEKDIGIVCYKDSQYPQKLYQSLGTKCPAFLFYKGNINLLNNSSVGFCGSRKVSEKGIGITWSCAKKFAKKEIVVVSGYAAGTDLAAHKSALEYSGATIFVLAEGILRMNVKNEIKKLLNNNNHVFVSQYLPELTWSAGNAMKRNGVIIGLSDAMILVESGKEGGTFAAGNETLEARHPLFVIDFAQPEVSAEANPYFISKGGIPIRGKDGEPNLEKVFSAIKDRNRQKKENDCFEQLKLT